MYPYSPPNPQVSLPPTFRRAFDKAFKEAVGTTCTTPSIDVWQKGSNSYEILMKDGKRPKLRLKLHLFKELLDAEQGRRLGLDLARAVNDEDQREFGMRVIIQDPSPPASATHGHPTRWGAQPHTAWMTVRSNGMAKGLSKEEGERYDGIKDKEALMDPEDSSEAEARRLRRAKEIQDKLEAEREKARLVKEAQEEAERLERERVAEEIRLIELEKERVATEKRLARENHYAGDSAFGLF